jgi:hypothetical protein
LCGGEREDTATHCYFRLVCCEEGEGGEGASVRCRMVWGHFPFVRRVAFPYVPVCAVASRVVGSVLRGFFNACRLGHSLCTLLLVGVVCVFVRGSVYSICVLTYLFHGGEVGVQRLVFRF